MTRFHEIKEARVEGTKFLAIIDGVPRTFDLPRHSRRLAGATPAQLACFEISPSAYGIHWPAVDEDLTIDGLIRGVVVDW